MTRDPAIRVAPRLGNGRFCIVDRLGDGGTATVYLCWDEVRRQWCALKALQSQFVDDEEMRARFSLEAEALAMFTHPNIPRLFHHDPLARPPFMVIELARCGSTMDWVRTNGPMPMALAADVIFQVCQALIAAHTEGIVHRDVKPHNFLLDDQGICKLTDFGIARLAETTSLTATGSQIGTFSFMAPEQRSDTKSVDHRADVYSLGASLFTLLTARTSAELFIADTDDELLADVHPIFREVILKATRYRADDRYPSVLVLQTDLMNALSRVPSAGEDQPSLVQAPSPLPPRPPKLLAPGLSFPDLEKLVPPEIVDDDRDGATGSSVTASSGSWSSLPYYMPERTKPNPRPQRSQTPDYLDSRQPGWPNGRDERDRLAREVTEEVRRALQRREEEPEEPVWGMGVATTAILATAAVVILGLLVIVGGGMASVSTAKWSADESATALMQALHEESGVVHQLRRDRTRFEEAYNLFREGRGQARLDAALAFVEALDEAHTGGLTMNEGADTQVRRLVGARNTYMQSQARWLAAATRFPGSVAVRSGLAGPPP
ncbi:MAG: serine/threonine protein kinase [Myxococcales bacterium]|nr:serine/threonine protein kinase [Myxococcales bacterium]